MYFKQADGRCRVYLFQRNVPGRLSLPSAPCMNPSLMHSAGQITSIRAEAFDSFGGPAGASRPTPSIRRNFLLGRPFRKKAVLPFLSIERSPVDPQDLRGLVLAARCLFQHQLDVAGSSCSRVEIPVAPAKTALGWRFQASGYPLRRSGCSYKARSRVRPDSRAHGRFPPSASSRAWSWRAW